MATVAFHAAFGQIGFTIATQNAIVAQGFDSIDGLIVLGKDDIPQICKIILDDLNPVAIPFMQPQLFEAMHYWVKTKIHCGKSTSTMLFTLAVAHKHAEKMIIDMEEIAQTDKESVKLPEKLQKQSMWLVFREALASYLSQKEGTGRIPLSYINHDLDVPDPVAVYETERERIKAMVLLQGLKLCL